jgi:hypothetical protein
MLYLVQGIQTAALSHSQDPFDSPTNLKSNHITGEVEEVMTEEVRTRPKVVQNKKKLWWMHQN